MSVFFFPLFFFFFNALEAICFRNSSCIRPVGKHYKSGKIKKGWKKKKDWNLFFKVSVLKGQESIKLIYQLFRFATGCFQKPVGFVHEIIFLFHFLA